MKMTGYVSSLRREVLSFERALQDAQKAFEKDDCTKNELLVRDLKVILYHLNSGLSTLENI